MLPDAPTRRLAPQLFRKATAALLLAPAALAWPVLGIAEGVSLEKPPQAAASTDSGDEELILTLSANGVGRGEFALLRKADGDFWLAAQDLPRLKLKPAESAKRHARGQDYVSLRALGAKDVVFDQLELALHLQLPAESLEGTRIDLANRMAPIEVGPAAPSAILNYRAVGRQARGAATRYELAGDLNVRIGELLLRQEARYDGALAQRRSARGVTQLIWDDRRTATRLVAGDLVASGGAFGTTFPGAGISYAKLYAITPDVMRQPTAGYLVSALAPADVEVTVDGSTLYRAHVGPGPVALENLFYGGGIRTVRVTVTETTGRRQVIEQPFLFTDSVLAEGLHEYAYFLGKRSELGVDNRWKYREGAWQASHRYGVTNHVTVQVGGEGSRDFASGGLGATVRHDSLGLLALDALRSVDRTSSRLSKGWSARYTYFAGNVSLFGAYKELDRDFRTFAVMAGNPMLLKEARLGASTRIYSAATVSSEFFRGWGVSGKQDSHSVRLSANITNRVSLHTEYQSLRTGGEKGWSVNMFLRIDLDGGNWTAATLRSGADGTGRDLEAGRQLLQGEGVGYRVGVTSNTRAGTESAFALGSANWNLRPFAVELSGASQLQGGNSHYLQAGVSGAVVATEGYMGMTRQVGDGFVLARLGVPHPGVDIFLNNQRQGKTGPDGSLLIPHVGAYGRQDVSLEDKQLPIQYSLATKRITIAPRYRSGTVVNFGAHTQQAVTGSAWLARGPERRAIAGRRWVLAGPAGRLTVETAPSGEFYLDDAPPGNYKGKIDIDGTSHACELTIGQSGEAVLELQEGIVCE